MGKTKNPLFYDFGIFEPATKPQNQLFLSLDTPGHFKKSKNNPWNIFQILCLQISTFWKSNPTCCQIPKRRAPKHTEDPRKQSSKSWMWDQYLTKGMIWKFGNSYQIFLEI